MYFATIALASFLIRLVAGDHFNYGKTNWEERDFGPPEWGEVQCQNTANCPGWPTNWDALGEFIEYDSMHNRCLDCSNSSTGECSRHMQSPINLEKSITQRRTCKDWHRMHFNRGNCQFGQYRFDILPHVLRAYQPKDGCQIDPCIDFSHGFPDEWLLRFTDISVPSQHTLEGKRYAAEVVMSHVLGVNKTDKEIGNVAWLLEEGDEEEDWYDFLELYIRRWQHVANRIRRKCRESRRMEEAPRNLREGKDPRFLSQIPVDLEPEAEATLEPMQDITQSHPYFERKFRFHPYDWYLRAGTHYYYRYQGSTIEPPCVHTVHWRVMRLPIKVAPSQIRALEALLSSQIDPKTCVPRAVGRPRENSTTAVDLNRPLQTVVVWPWKERTGHKIVYCECVDWESKLPNDQEYCSLSMEERGVYERGQVN